MMASQTCLKYQSDWVTLTLTLTLTPTLTLRLTLTLTLVPLKAQKEGCTTCLDPALQPVRWSFISMIWSHCWGLSSARRYRLQTVTSRSKCGETQTVTAGGGGDRRVLRLTTSG